MRERIAMAFALVSTMAASVMIPPVRSQDLAYEISSQPSTRDPLPERVLGFANGTSVSTDITYSTPIGYRPITLDLYRGTARGLRPLVIYVHGGAWMIGNTRELGAFRNTPAVLAELAAKGYVVASLEYRLAGEAPFPAAIDDVRTAIRFLKANAERYGIDSGHVAIWGASAGAQLAALAALDCGQAPSGLDKSNAEQSDCVHAAVAWYGVYDFSTLPKSFVPPAKAAYLDCKEGVCDPRTVAAASPVNYIDAKDPPMLLIHGTDDKTVSMAQSQELAAKLAAARVPVALEIIPGSAHGWKGVDDAATRANSLRALDLTFRFFDAQFKNAR